MKILYLCPEPPRQNDGGTTVVNRNREAIRRIVGDNAMVVHHLPRPSLKTVGRSLLSLSSYGMTRREEKRVVSLLRQTDCDTVFIEGSLQGNLVRRLAKEPCSTIVFAHNVETLLYRQRMERAHSPLSRLQYGFVRFNERLSFRHADRVIVLNPRDDRGMQSLFGRKADAILPITCPERPSAPTAPHTGRPYCLFVGSDFFPNVEGILWFIDRVAPHIPLDLRVVGSCCRNRLLAARELPSNVFLEGYVDDLSACYRNASAVVAPIFSGSGMKTKTIEAMSYGKSIFGTDEAFSGIECDYDRIGGLCNTAEDFIRCLGIPPGPENAYTQRLFSESYTDSIFENRLQNLFATCP